jgi:hypothetical protein
VKAAALLFHEGHAFKRDPTTFASGMIPEEMSYGFASLDERAVTEQASPNRPSCSAPY